MIEKIYANSQLYIYLTFWKSYNYTPTKPL